MPVDNSTVAELAEYLLQKASEAPGKRFVVAVSGVAGSGKTYISERIGNAVNRLTKSKEEVCVVLPMDGFHLTKAQLAAMDDPAAAFARRGAPWTFDGLRFVATVRQICQDRAAGSSIGWPSFDHAAGDPVEDAIEVVDRHRIVIIEGLYAHANEEPWEPVGSKLADELWWICGTDCQERLVQRHLAAGLAATRDEATQRAIGNDSANGEYAETHRHSPTRCIYN
ncbi:hypothetical protein IW140_005877 [Coemansia sp. RSA 1813]|nr:hypothetical protein EV178_005318 [Coemansia sp. RSA 1646]KAJ1766099.1 hypothetical protein LPJ74_006042 [Coemansia sp. RSA 1843]KAJ2086178.1 hypothetical protein IW138_005850 [Coemansia sp. RSA 986]KAJ2210916.1 hypothetical protein EV179_005905 [Coemansia sp. RSA 487]KAJ2564059.1 hypothetical protein IW140_005877 [Coemansia sp. RSA 1813]